jgi:hypothetical protein
MTPVSGRVAQFRNPPQDRFSFDVAVHAEQRQRRDGPFPECLRRRRAAARGRNASSPPANS